MKTIKAIINFLLCVGVLLIFNESDTFLPNSVGLACFVGLIVLNKDKAQTAQ